MVLFDVSEVGELEKMLALIFYVLVFQRNKKKGNVVILTYAFCVLSPHFNIIFF